MPAYPEIEPYRSRRLKVSGLHELYVEECGIPERQARGVPARRPGRRPEPRHRRFFDPARYRIVLFDQRGCGRFARRTRSCVDNTTWDLVADIERIRERLGHRRLAGVRRLVGLDPRARLRRDPPDRVSEARAAAIFLLRDEEIQWFYQEGASWLFPDAWEHYLDADPGGRARRSAARLPQAPHRRRTPTVRERSRQGLERLGGLDELPAPQARS